MKKKNLNTDKIIQGIKTPGGFMNSESQQMSKLNNSSGHPSARPNNMSKEKKIKYLKKLRLLGKFQSSVMQSVLQKIDRSVKPIKKNS